MGDLSRAQVLKKIARKILDLFSSIEGLAFFTFPNHRQCHRSQVTLPQLTHEHSGDDLRGQAKGRGRG
ncbi:Heme oxygenase 1 [Sciurus carolinensis]|uniref:Heme oxygenase 1 n=1 Tax=Sciurus carolinensis TaxID=30640 RepID=A0AA41NHD3_SCICA|nr:Heme oxygenase 1 [Sciurus carolinensis]